MAFISVIICAHTLDLQLKKQLTSGELKKLQRQVQTLKELAVEANGKVDTVKAARLVLEGR